MVDKVSIAIWDDIPLVIEVGVEPPTVGTLVYVNSYYHIEGGIYVLSEGGQLVKTSMWYDGITKVPGEYVAYLRGGLWLECGGDMEPTTLYVYKSKTVVLKPRGELPPPFTYTFPVQQIFVTDPTNQEDTAMNTSNDSISRSTLLSVLESREMTQGEMIELVRGAAPLEVDSLHNPYVTPTPPTEWYPGYPIAGLPDHMG